MSDIKVVLTTTKHIVRANLAPEDLIKYRDCNIPMCVAEMNMSLFGFGSKLERQELNFAQLCMNMCKVIQIDSKARHVFIGEDPLEITTGLIEYTDDIRDHKTDDFFSQWEKLNTLLMEYQVNDPVKKDSIFCVKGLWLKSFWHQLEILPGGKTLVIPEGLNL